MSSTFSTYIAEVNKEVAGVLARINERRTAAASLPAHPLLKLEEDLTTAVASAFEQGVVPEIELSTPPPGVEADYAIAAFAIGKATKRPPKDVAEKIAESIRAAALPLVAATEACGPYVNITVDRQKLYDIALRYIQESGAEYGKTSKNAGKVAVIDFSSPNIAKPLGIGHLRSTIIGHALSNIYEWTGYQVVRDNHLGDWGTQFGELIYAYYTWGNDEAIKKDPIRELKNLYVRFHNEEKTSPAIKIEARRLFGELDSGEEKLLSLWKQFRDWSISGFNTMYRRIGVHFDLYIGESYFTRQAEAVIEDCLAKEICKKDPDSSLIVVESLDGLPTFLLRKQDGSGLYITRDLAAIKYRVETFKPDALLYVVGSEQSLNFKQLFSLAKKAGYLTDNIRAEHVPFGMVLSGNKKMSTRAGTVVELEEVLEKATEKARETLKGNNLALAQEEEDRIVETVGIGAVLYHDLRQLRTTNISFDWEKITKLEAGTSAYLQYTHVRINSILEKAAKQGKLPARAAFRFENQKEFALAKKTLLFSQAIRDAQKDNTPHVICTYLEELSQQFNSLYAEVSVLTTKEDDLLGSRLALLAAMARVLENGLKILGIGIPLKM